MFNDLFCESLEPRLMLSNVVVFAAGQTGQETLEVVIDGEIQATYSNVGGNVENREFQVFQFKADGKVFATDVEVRFTNDAYDESSGLDRNLVVDKIRIDGIDYQTENASTIATSIWRDGEILTDGNFETEMLNVNGAFKFNPAVGSFGTRIRIQANGETGEEQFALRINDEVVQTYEAASEEGSFYYTVDGVLDPSDVKIEFLNDQYDSANGIDRNLRVRQIQLIDVATGKRDFYVTDSPQVFSTGTWRPNEGVFNGLGRGDTLHINGFFQYGADAGRTAESVLAEFDVNFAGSQPRFNQRTQFVDGLGREYLVGGSRFDAEDVLVVRLLDDGTIDPSYGENGLAVLRWDELTIPATPLTIFNWSVGGEVGPRPVTEVIRPSITASKLAFDSENKLTLVTSASANVSGAVSRISTTQWLGIQVLRFNEDGSVDTSFDDDGRNFYEYESGTTVFATEARFDDQDRLLVTGLRPNSRTSVILGQRTGISDEPATIRLEDKFVNV